MSIRRLFMEVYVKMIVVTRNMIRVVVVKIMNSCVSNLLSR